MLKTMRTRHVALFFIGIALVCGVPMFAYASTIWQSAPTHHDEVLIYTPNPANDLDWFNGTVTNPSIQFGIWNQSDFTTTASTSLHIWTRWNGGYINVLDVVLRASSGGDPFYGSGTTKAEVVTPFDDSYYRLRVYATSSLQEYTIPARRGETIHQGDEMWAFLYPSWASYGANHWLGSNGTMPYIELCEGPCGNDVPPPPPPPPDPCIELGTCASNVLFLPGIEASRLYEDIPCANGVCETQLWEPNGDALSSRLAHTTDGVSINTDIFTKKNGVIDNAYFPIKGNIYKSFIEQMNNLVTANTINKWEAVPYDWRLTPDQILESGAEIAPGKISYLVATSSPYIIQELKRLAATSKTGKVTIIAHSNGGLVTKALTDKLGSDSAQLIDKIIFVAVPQVGAVQAIGALLHGYDQGLPLDFLSYKLSDSIARFLATNMPMTYNLLPSSEYFTQVNTPVVTFANQPILADFRARYGDSINSSESLRTFITDSRRAASSTTEGLNYPSVGNNLLLTNAETLHNTGLDSWTPPSGITLYEIAGWGEKTLAGIDYYQGIATHCDQFSGMLSRCTSTPKIDYRPRIVLDGDGTVVTPSALWTPGAERYWVDLQSFAKDNRFTAPLGRQHADILEVGELRTFLQNIITNNSVSILPQYISTSTPVNNNPNTELRFTLHSPLTLNLYDDQGRHTGISTTTGELEENIPDSSYLKFGEVQFISAPASIHTTLIMNGYAEGSFSLDVEEASGESVVANTSFAGIPSFTTTTATMDMPSGGLANAGALVVDENSDGSNEIILAPKLGDTVTLDTTPPELQLAFSTSTESLAFIGTDDSGTATITATTTYPALKKNQKIGIATTTLIARDEAGNTTALVYTEPFPMAKQSYTITLRTIAYNGATTTLASTSASYEWNIYKKDLYRTFDSSLSTILGTFTSSYSSKDNKTTIMPANQMLSGMVVPYMATEKGSLKIIY